MSGKENDVTRTAGLTTLDKSIATVNSYGVITGKSKGTTYLSFSAASSEDMSVVVPRDIEINVDGKIDEVVEYRWSDDSIYMKIGDTENVKVYAIYRSGKKEDVTSQAKPESDSPEIATINKSGKITAISDGVARIVSNEYDIDCAIVEVEAGKKNSYGDLNSDGKINVVDVKLLQSFLIGEGNLSSSQMKMADVDGNGVLDNDDLKLLRNRSMGIKTPFPVE